MNRDRCETRYQISLRLNLHICQRANRKEMVKRCFSFQPQCVKVKSYNCFFIIRRIKVSSRNVYKPKCLFHSDSSLNSICPNFNYTSVVKCTNVQFLQSQLQFVRDIHSIFFVASFAISLYRKNFPH